MESVKNQISSPEILRFEELVGSRSEEIARAKKSAEAVSGEFRLIEFPSVPSPEVEVAALDTSSDSSVEEDMAFIPKEGQDEGPELFVLPKHFWKSLNSDSAIHNEIERIIKEEVEHRVAEALEQRFESVRPQVLGAAKEEGFRAGYHSGRSAGLDTWTAAQDEVSKLRAQLAQMQEEMREETSSRLNHLITEFLEQKAMLMKEHEKPWCDALVHLLKRFRIREQSAIGGEIERWLVESVSDFSNRKKIQVYLSELDYERQNALAAPKAEDKWELMKDPLLRKGEVRYECGGGGIFFSGSDEFQKLDELLKKFCVEDAADAT